MAPLKSRVAPGGSPTGKLCTHYVLVHHKVNSLRSLIAINSVLPTGQVLHVPLDAQMTSVPLNSLPRKVKMAIAKTVTSSPLLSSTNVTLLSPIVIVGCRRTPATCTEVKGGLLLTRSLSTNGFVSTAQDKYTGQHLYSSATSVLAWLKASQQPAPAVRPGGEIGTVSSLPCGATHSASDGCTAGHSVAMPLAATTLGSYSIKAVASSAKVTSAGTATDNNVKIPVAVVHRGVDEDAPTRSLPSHLGGVPFSVGDVTATTLREVTDTSDINPSPLPAASSKGLGTLIVSESWACIMLTERRDVVGDAAANGLHAIANISRVAPANGDATTPTTSAATERLGATNLGAGWRGDLTGMGVWHRPVNCARNLINDCGVRGLRSSRDFPADEAKAKAAVGANGASSAMGEKTSREKRISLVSPDRCILTDCKVPRVIKPPPEGVVLVPASGLQTPSATERTLLARAGITMDVRVYLLPLLPRRSRSCARLWASHNWHAPSMAEPPHITPHRPGHRPQPQTVNMHRTIRLQGEPLSGATIPSQQHRYRHKPCSPLVVNVDPPGMPPSPWPHHHGDSASHETCEAGGRSPSDGVDDIFYSENGACNGMDWTTDIPWEGGVGVPGEGSKSDPQPPFEAMIPSPPASCHDDTEQRDRLAWLRFTLREKQEAVEQALALSQLH